VTQLDSPEDVAVAAHRALAAAGLSDMIWGHASVRLPDRSGIVTKSSGWSLEEITTQRLVRVAWDGRRLAGDGTVHIEVPIHTQIMAARPDVEAVVHTHAPAVTAFASLGVPMRAISHDGVPFASPSCRGSNEAAQRFFSGSGRRPSGVVRRRRTGGEAGAGAVPKQMEAGYRYLVWKGSAATWGLPPT